MRVGCKVIAVLMFINWCFLGTAFSQPAGESHDKIGTVTIDVWEEPNVKYVFSAMPESDAEFLESYIIDCLGFAHDSYSFISWSKQAARRNLQHTLFEERIKSLQRYIEQTLIFAEIVTRLNPERERLPVILGHLNEMKTAVDLFIEGNVSEKDQKTPSDQVMRSGEIHEKIGKLLASLTVDISNDSEQEHRGHEH